MDQLDDLHLHTWWQRAWTRPLVKVACVITVLAALLSPWLWMLLAPTPAGMLRGWTMSEDELPEPPSQDVNAAWFEPFESFFTMPEPRPGDWLDEHDERGQSYRRYVYEQPNLPDKTRHTLYILPVGAFPEGDGQVDMQAIARACELYFKMPTRVLPAWHPLPGEITTRDLPTGEQWLTQDLIEGMLPALPEDAYAMLGVTMTDLWPGEGWSYVFGQARLRDRVGIQSFARYNPAFDGSAVVSGAQRDRLMRKRGLQVMTHEFGHMFGIRHCTAYQCNMNGSNSLEEADRQPIHLCPVCLRKLQHAVGFDPDPRYQQLADFYREQRLEAPAAWIDARRDEVINASAR